jgi:cytochrome b involved in lipid metabolism
MSVAQTAVKVTDAIVVVVGISEKPTNAETEAADIRRHYIGKDGKLHVDELPTHCDACPCCYDTCGVEGCVACAAKLRDEWRVLNRSPSPRERRITSCQVRRNRTISSCWLVLDDQVIDCTPQLTIHPGGIQSILRRCGSTENRRIDFDMHSASARKAWKRHAIGRYIGECPGRTVLDIDSESQCQSSFEANIYDEAADRSGRRKKDCIVS